MTVHIVQPAIPHYRVDFFDRLQALLAADGIEMRIYASVVDELGVKSVEIENPNWKVSGKVRKILGLSMIFQGGWNFPIQYGDIIIMSGNPRVLSNYLIMLRAKWFGAHLIWWGQLKGLGPVKFIKKKIREFIWRICDAVVLYTEAELDQISQEIKAKSIFAALNNGLNGQAIQSELSNLSREELERFRQEAGLRDDTHYMIFVGRLTQKSNFGIFDDALGQIPENIGLICVGDVSSDPVNAALAKGMKAKWKERVIFAGPITSESELRFWMKSAKLFVYPGSVGLSIIHALHYGLPVIIHDKFDYHMPEVAAFCAGKNGLTFVKDDATSLANTISELITDQSLVSSMSGQATSTVSSSFNTGDMARRMHEVICKLIVQPPARSSCLLRAQIYISRIMHFLIPARWEVFIGYRPQNSDKLVIEIQQKIVAQFGKYFADPFIAKTNTGYMLFVEQYDLITRRGDIVIFRMDNLAREVRQVGSISTDTHLSYPRLLKTEDGELYLFAESVETQEVATFKSTTFPDGWVQLDSPFPRGEYVDPNVFEVDGRICLIACERSWNSVDGFGRAVFLRGDRSGLYTSYTELSFHNPDLGPNRCRGAGLLRATPHGIFRYVQDNTRSYGGGLIAVTGTIECSRYIERAAEGQYQFEPLKKGTRGIHTINECGDIVAFDVLICNPRIFFEIWICRFAAAFILTARSISNYLRR